MPVLPLVGSTTSTPDRSTPRSSASQIIEAPIRSLTEYAGPRLSSLPRMRAFVPAPMRFRWTSGVPPIERELSSKMRAMPVLYLIIGNGLVHVHQLRRAGDDARLRGDALGEPHVPSHHGVRADPHRAQD